MKNTMTIALKELKSYLTSPMAYVVTAIFLAGTGFVFSISPSTYMETSVNGFLGIGSILLLWFTPLLTMRLLAEERKMGTLELLLTAPVRDSEAILGKFLGSAGILTAMLTLTLYYPITVCLIADPKPDCCRRGRRRNSPCSVVRQRRRQLPTPGRGTGHRLPITLLLLS
ncbi:MAG: ABC transporter permease subunit [Chloroflexi bacterium]|nr:ABC transporter permease subunit [Chloroflexota bacterium]